MPPVETQWIEQPLLGEGTEIYHLYEDGTIMLYEDGTRMLIDSAFLGAWTEQPAITTNWVEV